MKNVMTLLVSSVCSVVLCVGVAAQQTVITPTARDLNKSFDADRAQWTERFEHEGRAIYDNRYAILDELAS